MTDYRTAEVGDVEPRRLPTPDLDARAAREQAERAAGLRIAALNAAVTVLAPNDPKATDQVLGLADAFYAWLRGEAS